MMLRATIAAAVATIGCAGSAGASRVLVQGPMFAGAAVLWGEQDDADASLRRWTAAQGERTIVSNANLALVVPPAASAKIVSFVRSYPGCTPQPGSVCPQEWDAVAGPIGGPFRPLLPPMKCFPAAGPAVDGTVVAAVERDCSALGAQVVVAGRVVYGAAAGSGCCTMLRIAGRYVAWQENRRIVVYDRKARRVAYDVSTPSGVDTGFDVGHDGRLVVVRDGKVAWYSRASPRAHVLPLSVSSTHVRLVGGLILVRRSSSLFLSDLGGRGFAVVTIPRTLRFRGSFDFDGRRAAWATDRVDSKRVDCPPPGQERPCVLRESGLTTIWLRPIGGGAIRRVARLPFVDAVGGVPRRVR